MKKSSFQFDDKSKNLFKIILSLKNNKECEQFFRDLLTLSELKSITERWEVVNLLKKGITYRKICEKTGVSTATITRISNWIENGTGGYNMIYNRLHSK